MSDYTYQETEPYEKGFASHYLKTVVPVLGEARDKHVKAITQLRLHVGVVVALVVIAGLAWTFGFIDKKWVVGRSGEAMGIAGEHRGRRFEFAEVKVTKSQRARSSDTLSQMDTLFDGVVLHVAFPRVPGTTHVVKDRGGLDNFFEGLERVFTGVRKVPLGNAALESEYEVYANDEAAARMLVGEELIGATGEFARLIGASRLGMSFFGTSFVLKIETGVDFFEPDGLGGDAFGPETAKQFVREIHTLLKVVEAAARIADKIGERAGELIPDGFTEDIIENDDGTFSVHGRTYKSRETAEAYLEHYG